MLELGELSPSNSCSAVPPTPVGSGHLSGNIPWDFFLGATRVQVGRVLELTVPELGLMGPPQTVSCFRCSAGLS